MTTRRRSNMLSAEVGEAKLVKERVRACAYCELRDKGFCRNLAKAEQTFVTEIRRKNLNRHETLFRQGDETENIYIVRTGFLRLYYQRLDGQRQVVGFAKPGDILPFPLSQNSDYGVDALNSVYLCQFSRRNFIAFVQSDPIASAALTHEIYVKLVSARQQLAFLRDEVTPKVARFLLWLQESCASSGNDPRFVPVRVTQADIADFLGITTETVNRAFARLRRDMIIQVDKYGINFLNLERLKDIAKIV